MTATLAPPPSVRAPERTPPPRARSYGALVLMIVIVVVAADQLAKAWAWRNLTDVHINAGGNPFTGATLGNLLEDRVAGAYLDVVNASLLAAGAWLLVRYCRSRIVAVAGALLLAGWVSNMADRLGLHLVTAPNSVRGVVDFIPFDGHYWNLADVVIALGTVGFVLAATGSAARALLRPRTRRRAARRWPAPAAVLLAVAGLTTVCVLAVHGTAEFGYLDAPVPLG